ncbi:LysM peptidoglycan-binding domain-containing protein [Nitratireductor mangrovi]|uniref:LysM peptidoglycan-binding domain-containing protein n=1 Tax=Nitratireductor mangrovi TaxID=2599600 RepID=A0A6H0DXV6_9HYPH|nr:LysM peptidoglycan-binding domain-containing protein [Nitratireductor mangrovi]QIS94628.1 LysM peptidoglycan-binding domain-containing protein [Nitratireductor mangrovi]
MVISPLKALLFLAGGSAAAVTTAYVTGALDGVLEDPPAMIAALPDPAAPDDAPGEAVIPAPDKPDAAPAAGNNEDAPPDKAEVVPPTFDLVRVEPDGSVVLAGKAAANAAIEIITGTTVIARTTATPEGDFAVVLDDPLKPGDYQIVLRSTTPDNLVATSVETALVSVPETASGEVLALVEEPGKPSKLITVPKAAPAEAATEEVAPAEEAEPAATAEAPAPETEEAPPAPDTAEAPAVESEAPAEETAAAPAEAGETVVARAEPDPAVEPEAEGMAEEPQAAAPEAAPADAAEAPAEEAESTPAAAEPEPAEEPVDVARADPAPAEQATPEPPAAEPAAQAPAPAEADRPVVLVEAVEIEGRKVFVAGIGQPGLTVRVYANADLLGETEVSPSGRFLIETERDLPVGDYIIRADLLDDGGRKVVARAAVPFQREPGEAIAAVAPAPEMPAPVVVETEPRAETPAEADGEEELAMARAEEKPAMSADNGETEAAEAPAAAKPEPEMKAATPAGETGEDTAGKEAASPEPAVTSEKPAPEAVVAATEPAADTVPTAPEVEEVLAPKLQPVASAVIIRRGDTLWRISRRVYGRGIRYSTIYLANQDQIEDPHRIWPGQVFRVPDKSNDGEDADMQAMEDQMTTIEASGDAASAIE